MSTKQATKRAATAKKSETVPKKMQNVSVRNNNVDVKNENVQADGQVPVIIDGTVKSRKLPDEVLQKFHNEPSHLLIAGNVAWHATGGNKTPQRNELTVFHRFTAKKVSKSGGN